MIYYNITEKLFSVLNIFQIKIASVILNSDRTFVSINRKFEQLSGYLSNEINNGVSFLDFLSGENLNKIKTYFEQASNGGADHIQPETFECKFTNRTGHQKFIILALNWVPKSNNFIASITDITKIKKSQLNSIRSKHLETIAILGSGVAHKINNPLSAINTSVEILKNGLELEGQDLKLMDIICEETMSLNLIIRDFIQFTRLKESKFEPIQINSLINETLQSFDGNFWKGIVKKNLLSQDLPNIFADKKQMQHVLRHIISNAVEAMPYGGVLSISTANAINQYQENQIQIIIADTGTGINESDMKLIFKPFFTTNNKKAGMGLPFCERVIYNHNGEIKIESKFDQGTKVTIILPLESPF